MDNQKQPKTYDNNTLKTATFFAFFPLTGVFGLHEAALKQYKLCCIRMVIILLTVASIVITAYRLIDIPPGFPQIFLIITAASPLIAMALYAWAIAEGAQYLQKIREQKTTPTLGQEDSPTESGPQITENSVENHDTAYYASDLTDGTKREQKQNSQKEEGNSTIAAFVLAAVLICWWGSVFFTNSARNAGCSGGLTGVFFMLLLSIPIDVIMTTLIMYFGTNGLNTKSRGIAIASLVMKAVALILMIGAFIYIHSLQRLC